MSTSFMLERLLQLLLDKYGLSMYPIDQNREDLDWRIINPGASIVFQGTLDRCSDFAKGLHYGRTGERAL